MLSYLKYLERRWWGQNNSAQNSFYRCQTWEPRSNMRLVWGRTLAIVFLIFVIVYDNILPTNAWQPEFLLLWFKSWFLSQYYYYYSSYILKLLLLLVCYYAYIYLFVHFLLLISSILISFKIVYKTQFFRDAGYIVRKLMCSACICIETRRFTFYDTVIQSR